MAMKGLEKITEKILAEANAEAERILAKATAESEQITADYAARAENIRETLSAQAEKEATDLISRAKSAAAMQKRNLLLQAQSDLIDRTFADALAETLALDKDKYTGLMIGLLTAALLEQFDAETESRSLYGEDALLPDAYEVLMNQNDRVRIGADVIEGVRKKLSGKVPAERLSLLQLSEKTVSVDGGLILRCGDIESNCSLSLIFAQLREELESEVSRALFAERAQA